MPNIPNSDVDRKVSKLSIELRLLRTKYVNLSKKYSTLEYNYQSVQSELQNLKHRLRNEQ